MVKVLVACADYPKDGGKALQYVHVRNKEYVNKGIVVDVLNFSQKENYVYEGIDVFCLDYIKKNIETYRNYILICHAPNLRNHYMFIKKYGCYFKNMVFFFHGHEIVEQRKVYPRPYSFKRSNLLLRIMVCIYDKLKISLWSRYFCKTNMEAKLIFVSNCLMQEFMVNMKIAQGDIQGRATVINNGVSKVFQTHQYDWSCKKEYDYITIRSDIDSSVYCVDLICELAERNPDKRFLLIGKGNYFNYHEMPQNMTHIGKVMRQEELVEYINSSRIALMPTRRDSQGVMACELATFGIPLVTSSISVCREMFGSFENVVLLDEAAMKDNVDIFFRNEKTEKNKTFFVENTIEKEIEIFNEISVGSV